MPNPPAFSQTVKTLVQNDLGGTPPTSTPPADLGGAVSSVTTDLSTPCVSPPTSGLDQVISTLVQNLSTFGGGDLTAVNSLVQTIQDTIFCSDTLALPHP
jgi:hypothetical protein